MPAVTHITIPLPVCQTGPSGLSETEAAEHYLRVVRDRITTLHLGSGVTALVTRLLDDTISALGAHNPVLTNEERMELEELGRNGWRATEMGDWLATRDGRLRKKIAEEIGRYEKVTTGALNASDYSRGLRDGYRSAIRIVEGD